LTAKTPTRRATVLIPTIKQSMTSSRVVDDSMAASTPRMSAKGAAGALGEKGPREVAGGELEVRALPP
jgi:hypothetical protein